MRSSVYGSQISSNIRTEERTRGNGRSGQDKDTYTQRQRRMIRRTRKSTVTSPYPTRGFLRGACNRPYPNTAKTTETTRDKGSPWVLIQHYKQGPSLSTVS